MAAEPHAPPGRTRPESPQHDAGARPAAHVRHAALIVNTRSRRGRVLFRDAIDQLEAKGIALDASHSVGDPRRLAAVVEREVARGAGTIIVGGGDGTIGAIAGVLANRDIVLGLLPLGTGNNFATRTLGIPASLDGAVDVIAAGHSVAVDLGEVNGHYFVNTASIGLSSEVARETPPGLKRHLGVLAYALTGLRLLVARRRFRCTVVLAGRRESFRTHQLVVANGSHFGVAKVAPEVLLESGQLLVFSIATSTRWRTLRAWARFFVTGHRQAIDNAHRFVTRSATIEAVPNQRVDVDGELRTRTPAHVRVAAEALRVLAPAALYDGVQKRTPTPA